MAADQSHKSTNSSRAVVVPPTNSYDVGVPPTNSYDVGVPPNNSYDVGVPPTNSYDVGVPPRNSHGVGIPPSNRNDVGVALNGRECAISAAVSKPNNEYDVGAPMAEPNNEYDVGAPLAGRMAGEPAVYAVPAAGGGAPLGTAADVYSTLQNSLGGRTDDSAGASGSAGGVYNRLDGLGRSSGAEATVGGDTYSQLSQDRALHRDTTSGIRSVHTEVDAGTDAYDTLDPALRSHGNDGQAVAVEGDETYEAVEVDDAYC
jgi:hypothetical protein